MWSTWGRRWDCSSGSMSRRRDYIRRPRPLHLACASWRRRSLLEASRRFGYRTRQCVPSTRPLPPSTRSGTPRRSKKNRDDNSESSGKRFDIPNTTSPRRRRRRRTSLPRIPIHHRRIRTTIRSRHPRDCGEERHPSISDRIPRWKSAPNRHCHRRRCCWYVYVPRWNRKWDPFRDVVWRRTHAIP